MTNDDLVTFDLPADFVTARSRPTAAELAYGLDHGWIGAGDVVAIAEVELADGIATTPVVEELALLLRDEYVRVPDILAGVDVGQEDAWRLWLFLALAWLRENRDRFQDPYEVIELIYADFGYPEEIVGLVRFMPAPAGAPVGLDAIDGRWASYLDERAHEYARRSSTA